MTQKIEREVVIKGNVSGALSAIQALAREEESLEAKLNRAEAAAVRAFEEATPKAYKEAISAAKAYEDAVESNTRALRQQEEAAERAAKAADYDTRYSSASQAASVYGDLDSNVLAVGGLLRGAGAGGAADALTGVADIAAATEGINRLSAVIPELAERAVAAVPAVNSVAGGFLTMAPALGATGAALTAVATVAIPLVAVGGAVAFAFADITRRQQEAVEAAKNYADELERTTTREFEAGRLLSEGNTAAIKDKLAAAQMEKELQQSIIDTAVMRADQAQKEKDQLIANRILYDNSIAPSAEYTEKMRELNAIIDASVVTVDQARPILKEAASDTAYYSSVVETQAFKASEAAAKVEELTARQDEYRASLAAAEKQVQSYADQINDLNDRFAQSNSRAAVDEIMKNIFDATEASITASEKAEDAAIARAEREDALQKRIADIQQSGIQKAIDTTNAIIDITTKRDADLLDIETKYQDQAKNDAQRFADRRKEIEQSYQDSLKDSQLNNDFFGFLEAKDNRERALKDVEREERRAEKERRNGLEDERQKIIEAASERITQLNNELEVFQNNVQTRVKAETDAFTVAEQKLEERESRNEERANARADRREAYEEALETRREARALEDHNAALARMDEMRDAAVKTFEAVEIQLGKVTTAAEKYQLQIDELLKSSTGNSNDPNYDITRPVGNYPALPDAPISSGGGGINEVASMRALRDFNRGAMRDMPPLPMPPPMSSGLAGARAGGGLVLNISPNITVAPGMDRTGVERVIIEGLEAFGNGLATHLNVGGGWRPS